MNIADLRERRTFRKPEQDLQPTDRSSDPLLRTALERGFDPLPFERHTIDIDYARQHYRAEAGKREGSGRGVAFCWGIALGVVFGMVIEWVAHG